MCPGRGRAWPGLLEDESTDRSGMGEMVQGAAGAPVWRSESMLACLGDRESLVVGVPKMNERIVTVHSVPTMYQTVYRYLQAAQQLCREVVIISTI